jgi:tRNA 2-thiouridine synthesizing protein A
VSDIKPVRTVDTTGSCCPVPIVETNRAIKTLRAGDVLEVIATDSGALMDIPAWCRRTGHALMETEDLGGSFHFYIRHRP